MMELAEVVNPNVAVPVVGVILCFVLVYAFGFKSPVQPPSFELDEEDSKKTKTKSKHKKKSQPNGHIVALEQLQQVTVRQTASGRQVAATGKAEVATSRVKTPKKQQTKSPKPQQSARTEVTEQTPQPSEDNEAGEWMTAQSKKKNKRNKRGQDEGGKKEMPATPKQEEVKVEDVPVEGVKAEATPAAEEPQVEAAAPVEKKQKKRKETKLPAKSDVTLKSNVSLDVSAEKELKDTADMQIKQSDPPQVEEKQKVSPKKSKKEKKAAKVAVSVPDVVVKDSVITVTTDAKLEPQPSGVEAELIAAMEDEVVTPQAEDTQKEAGDEMATKLSKNSRKKKTKESREKYAEKNPKSESMESAGQTVTSPSETTGADVSTAQQTSPTDRLQTGPVAMTTEVADGAAESLLKSEEQSPVTFDELGEWQEAKPVKSKKKRARRDN